MTRLYVPPLRKRFILNEDWTFPLHQEGRNYEFANYMKAKFAPCPNNMLQYYHKPPPVDVTLPKGTEMYIDRYYIKNGGSEYDSITFRIKVGKRTQRFWVKLADANTIEAEFDID